MSQEFPRDEDNFAELLLEHMVQAPVQVVRPPTPAELALAELQQDALQFAELMCVNGARYETAKSRDVQPIPKTWWNARTWGAAKAIRETITAYPIWLIRTGEDYQGKPMSSRYDYSRYASHSRPLCYKGVWERCLAVNPTGEVLLLRRHEPANRPDRTDPKNTERVYMYKGVESLAKPGHFYGPQFSADGAAAVRAAWQQDLANAITRYRRTEPAPAGYSLAPQMIYAKNKYGMDATEASS